MRALLRFAEIGSDSDLPQSLRELAEAMDLEEVQAALAALEELDASPSQVRAFKAVLSRWAQLEPTAAFSHVAAMNEHGATVMIHGHTHRPGRHDIALGPGARGTRWVLGDWNRCGWYLRYDGEAELVCFRI